MSPTNIRTAIEGKRSDAVICSGCALVGQELMDAIPCRTDIAILRDQKPPKPGPRLIATSSTAPRYTLQACCWRRGNPPERLTLLSGTFDCRCIQVVANRTARDRYGSAAQLAELSGATAGRAVRDCTVPAASDRPAANRTGDSGMTTERTFTTQQRTARQ